MQALRLGWRVYINPKLSKNPLTPLTCMRKKTILPGM
jgi:hypothetical protein